MPGQQKIEATAKQARQRFPRTAGQVSWFIARRQIERVMSYDDFLYAIGKSAELFFHPQHLSVIDTAAFDDESPGCIDAGNCDFIIEVEGFEVIGNILLINIEASSESRINVVQRNVMIPRHNYLRGWQRPQERTGSFELTRPGTLRQVARNGDHIRLNLMNRANELFDDSVICPAEVDIGNVD
jgi:hypothetical protein